MTVTVLSSVLGEIGVLRACADSLNEAAASSAQSGGINALTWEDALHALDGLRLAVETLQQLDAALTTHLYLVGEHGATEIPGLGVVTIQRSRTRTQWDHDDWKHDVRGALLEDHHVPTELFDMEGNSYDIPGLIAEVQDIHGAQAPKVTALRQLGLDPKAYCHEVPGKPSVTIQRSSK